METRVTPCLMFQDGEAANAAAAYAALFEDGEAVSAIEGGTTIWTVTVGGQSLRIFDSPVRQEFGFSPAMSMFVTTDTEVEVRRLFDGLAPNGTVLMKVDAYPFSRCYGWVQDRFGVSWQIGVAD